MQLMFFLLFFVPTDVIRLCGKIRIRKSCHYGGQAKCKVKINNIQRHVTYLIKKEEFSGDISKFPLFQWHSLFSIIVNYFLFSLSPRTKEELKACKSLDSYNLFASGWVKEAKIIAFMLPIKITLVIGRVST